MTQQIRRVGQHAALFAAIRQELFSDHLDEQLGDYRFDVDLLDRVMVFSSDRGKVTAHAEFVASIAVDPATMLWGWAPLFGERVKPDSAVHQFRAFGELHRLAEFTNDEVPYELGSMGSKERIAALSHDVGAAAVEVLGPDWRYYSMPSGSAGSRGVVALTGWSEAMPEPTMIDVFTKLPRLLSDVDDVAWSLEGLANLMPGWRFERRPDAGPGAPVWRLTDAEGQWFELTTEFDNLGRLTSVKANGLHQGESPAA